MVSFKNINTSNIIETKKVIYRKNIYIIYTYAFNNNYYKKRPLIWKRAMRGMQEFWKGKGEMM